MFSQPEVHVFPAWSVCLGWGKATFSLGKGIVFPRKDTLWLEKGHFQLPIPSISAFPKNTGVSKKLVLAAQENHFPGFVSDCILKGALRAGEGNFWHKIC